MLSFLSNRSSRPDKSCHRSSHRRYSVKKVFSEISQNSQENTCVRESFLIKLQALGKAEKDFLTQVFSCKFCEISKNTFFIEHLQTTASAVKKVFLRWNFFIEKYLWCSLSFNKISELRSANLLTRDSSICVFLSISQML